MDLLGATSTEAWRFELRLHTAVCKIVSSPLQNCSQPAAQLFAARCKVPSSPLPLLPTQAHVCLHSWAVKVDR
eukprot:720543-Pleurochrysis_carterae.AAC.1